MADRSGIEWTDATWNPIRARNIATGKVGWHCEHATTGCELCYAEGFNKRLGTGLPFKPGHRKDIELFLDEDMLTQPLRWKKPRVIFPCSMTDLFADFVPVEWIDRTFAVMALSPQHTFQVLTKRAARMRDYFNFPSVRERIVKVTAEGHQNVAVSTRTTYHSRTMIGGDWQWPLPNVWLGVSTERQQEADERIPLLLQTPAAIRFISAEPLLGPIDLTVPNIDIGIGRYKSHPDLDWVIVGGESGRGARPMHPDWARSLRDQCHAAGVPFFFKQWGQWAPATQVDEPWRSEGATILPDGRMREWEGGEGRLMHPDMASMCLVGKKRGGRLLDGVEHNGFPEARS